MQSCYHKIKDNFDTNHLLLNFKLAILYYYVAQYLLPSG